VIAPIAIGFVLPGQAPVLPRGMPEQVSGNSGGVASMFAALVQELGSVQVGPVAAPAGHGAVIRGEATARPVQGLGVASSAGGVVGTSAHAAIAASPAGAGSAGRVVDTAVHVTTPAGHGVAGRVGSSGSTAPGTAGAAVGTRVDAAVAACPVQASAVAGAVGGVVDTSTHAAIAASPPAVVVSGVVDTSAHAAIASSPAAVRKSGTPFARPVKTAGSAAPVTVPFVSIAIPVPAPPPELPAAEALPTGRENKAAPEQVQPQSAPERLAPADTALQVVIRQQVEVEPVKAALPPRAMPETPVVPVASAPPIAPPVVAVASHSASSAPTTREVPTAPRAAAPPEPPSHEPVATPLKSVSLEFTPDGAGDIKLRVAERAGEVHISLHSSDPSLSGRLHEGVQDLVGSLSKAGYDAEAWTPGQGGRQQQEQPRQQQQKSPSPGEEDFDGIYEQQPIQEVL
jgi:hypothetical protein